jgi:hypothetical protein
MNTDYQLIKDAGFQVIYRFRHLFLCSETGVVKAVPLLNDKLAQKAVNEQLPHAGLHTKLGKALSRLATALVENDLELPRDITSFRKRTKNKNYQAIRSLGLDVQIHGSSMLLLDEDEMVCKSLSTSRYDIKRDASRIRNGSHGDMFLRELLLFAQSADLSTTEKRDIKSFTKRCKDQTVKHERVKLKIEGARFSTVQKHQTNDRRPPC